MEESDHRSAASRRVLRAVIIASVALIPVEALQWSLIEWLTPFLMLPVLGILWLAFIAIGAWALIHLVMNRRSGVSAVLPAAASVMSLAIVWFVPFTDIWLRANFALLKGAREDTVKKVLAGNLRSNVGHNSSLIALSSASPHVSQGGNEIVVEEHDGKKYIFFFTYRGILDNYSGFLYVPEGGDPARFSDLNESESTQIVQFGGPWVYASHR